MYFCNDLFFPLPPLKRKGFKESRSYYSASSLEMKFYRVICLAFLWYVRPCPKPQRKKHLPESCYRSKDSSFLHQDTQKAKQFLPFLQRAGRSEAVVEYVFSGSRLKLYLPKETCLITFLLAGKSYVFYMFL